METIILRIHLAIQVQVVQVIRLPRIIPLPIMIITTVVEEKKEAEIATPLHAIPLPPILLPTRPVDTVQQRPRTITVLVIGVTNARVCFFNISVSFFFFFTPPHH